MTSREISDKFPSSIYKIKFGNFVNRVGKFIPNFPRSHGITSTNDPGDPQVAGVKI